MKNILIVTFRLLLAGALVYTGVKVLYPHIFFRIEKLEYFIIKLLPISWLVIPFISRFLIGLFFVISFLMALYWPRVSWLKYLSPLMLVIPFIINPVLPKDFKDEVAEVNENIHHELADFATSEERVLVAYLSANCLYCYNAAQKLYAAKLSSKHFPEVKVIGVTESINLLFEKTGTDFNYTLIDKDLFLQLTDYQYPKIHLVENGVIKKKYNGYTLNYRVMHNLSQK